MDYTIVARAIRDELGAPPDELFAEFGREPVAAASIGQVHRAVLHDGTEVAVKVQYPGVDRAMIADLGNIGALTRIIGALTPTLDARALADELKVCLLEELDYLREADNQKLFAKIFADYPYIRVPRVFGEFSSQRVLCSEYARGLSFYEFVKVANLSAKRRACTAIHEFAFDAIWFHHVFNGDPHPGNYVFDESGVVTFLDFGCVKRFDKQFIGDFRALNRARLDGDKQTYYDIARKMHFILPGKEHKAAVDWLWDYTEWFYRPIAEDKPFVMTEEYCRQSLSKIFGENMRKVNMPPDYLMLNRITFGLNSILAKLESIENWHQLSRKYYYLDAGSDEPQRREAGKYGFLE